MTNDGVSESWNEALYLLLTRYEMPEPERVVEQFVEYREAYDKDVPAIGQIRENIDTSTTDLSTHMPGDERTDEEIRAYLRTILSMYDERVGQVTTDDEGVGQVTTDDEGVGQVATDDERLG